MAKGKVFTFFSALFLSIVSPGLFPGHAFYTKAQEKEASVPIIIGNNFGKVYVRPKVKPLNEIKMKNIVRQKLDFSCGSAAVATIFKYYLGLNVTEEQVINGLFKVGNVKKIIKRKGFSLLDIKKLAVALGYKAAGYKIDLKGLSKINKPAIVSINLGRYKHFVIFKGVRNGRVFLSDPSRGNTVMSAGEFEKVWYKNIALIIFPKNEKANFGISDEELNYIKSDFMRQSIYRQVLPGYKTFSDF
ncbi:C39 family peptidase [Persephonella sp.]